MDRYSLLPFDRSRKKEFVAFVCAHYGDALTGRERLLKDDDGLEELAFRIACGEFDGR